jgi:hypothetical protein
MSKITSTFAVAALAAVSGQALAGEVSTTFLATNGTLGYVFEAGTTGAQSGQLSLADPPESIQAISNGINGRVILHGARTDGSGVWYYLNRNGSTLTTTEFAQTDAWYNSFTLAGERMFAVKNIANDADQIVELDPFSFAEIGSVGSFDIGIGGIAWVPELGEFIVSDTRTNTFFGVSFGGDTQTSSTLREIGAAGLRWGGNGLEYDNGRVYGTGIRGEDMMLVFGEVNLQTGAFEVQRVLGEAARAGVGFGIIPSPGVLPILGAGGLFASRRRRR